MHSAKRYNCKLLRQIGQLSYEVTWLKKSGEWIDGLEIRVDKILGIRTFWALQQNNEIKYDTIWQEKMFEIEMKVSDMNHYKNISFYNHVLLRKAL